MKIRWLAAALDDLSGIREYIARDNPAAAQRVLCSVRDAVNLLIEHPGLGRPGRLAGTRELVVRRYPYIVAYRQVDTQIQVLAVVHTSRRWPDELP
jgi:toxin ParE1/3/4